MGGVENKRFIVDGLQRNCMPEDVRFVVVEYVGFLELHSTIS